MHFPTFVYIASLEGRREKETLFFFFFFFGGGGGGGNLSFFKNTFLLFL